MGWGRFAPHLWAAYENLKEVRTSPLSRVWEFLLLEMCEVVSTKVHTLPEMGSAKILLFTHLTSMTYAMFHEDMQQVKLGGRGLYVEISIQIKYFLWFSWSNNYMPLLNTKLLLLLFLQKIKPRSQSEISRTHNIEVLPGKRKAKNPTIIYYVYHGSWNNLIQNSNPRALSTIQSSHIVIQKLTNSCANILSPDNLPPLHNPCN